MATNFIEISKVLIPRNNLEFHHALDDVAVLAGDNGPASFVSDYSGNARTLLGNTSIPLIKKTALKTNFFDYKPAAYFDGTNNPLKFTGATVSVKHIFLLVKFDGAAFTGEQGLLSDATSFNVLAGAGAGATRFYNLGLNYSYQKNNAGYPESNLLAPMNEIGLLEIQIPAGLPMNGYQIGQQIGGSNAKWKGWFFENIAYSRVLTETERQKVLMYLHLKFGTQKYGSNVLYFPSDNFLDFRRYRFKEEDADYDAVTDNYEFDDGGKTFFENAVSAPRYWQYEYRGRTPLQLSIFREFYKQVRQTGKFNFVDKYGETFSDVQIESYSGDHEGHKSWRNDAIFRLVKFP